MINIRLFCNIFVLQLARMGVTTALFMGMVVTVTQVLVKDLSMKNYYI